MIPSLNEVGALARKACTGAGYSWGLSEDASRAAETAWHFGFDSISALADLLQAKETGRLSADCPLHLGAEICDTQPDTPIRLEKLASPVLLLFFAADLPKISGISYRITLKSAVYYATPTGLYQAEDQPDTAVFTLQPAAPDGHPLTPAPRRPAPETAWATLTRFANRTYAPATESSRQSGAGAGTTDTD